MNTLCKKLVMTALVLTPAISFAAEKSAVKTSEKSGYYELNIGDFSKPEKHHALPENGIGNINVKHNSAFSITFPANPTTGYSWGLRRLPDNLLLIGVDYRQSADCEKGAVGCGGRTTYTFKAVEQGSGTVKFQYSRTWEKGEPDETAININVK